MPKITVEIEEESLDQIILEDLVTHYGLATKYSKEDKKLLKALKRVIEYYGGNVDE